MSRTEWFNKKYNMETPEQKKEREEAELKAKKKEARKAKKAVKQRVVEEMGDFTGINKDWEGKLIKKMTEEKEAEKTPYDHLDAVITKYNLPVANDYVAVDKGFLNKLVEDTKLNVQEENDKMNAEQIKVIVSEVMAAMNENKNRELELQIKLQEAQNDALRMQLELAELAMERHLSGMDNNTPVETAKAQVEEQFEEKPKRGRRKGKLSGKVEEVSPALEDTHVPADCPIDTKYITHRGINWKLIREEGKFMDTLLTIVNHTAAHGVDVSKGKNFKDFSKVTNGAYQQFMIENRGFKGAWKSLMQEFGIKA